MKTFQSLFPSLSPQTLSLSQARRVVLVSYNQDRGTVDIRHYIITVKPYGVSRRLRKLLEGGTSTKSSFGFPNLGTEKDVADFVLRKRGEAGPAGYESASSADSAAGDEHATVDLADDYVGRNNKRGQRRAVRLDEVGPRLELRLIKIAEGIPGKEGGVIYHGLGVSFAQVPSNKILTQFPVKKSAKEVAELSVTHAAKERLRQERREEQERNVQRKKALTTRAEGEDSGESENDLHSDQDEGVWDEDEEISEGEASEEGGSDTESSEEESRLPVKRPRVKGKR